jgi:glycosyltransferase involved in cell wall biosynthesis
MRVLIALPGLHRHNRGAEAAFIALASELARMGDIITLIGSGRSEATAEYRFLRARSVRRERFESFPFIPVLRHEFAYEELTFVPELLWQYRPNEYDITVTCSFPFTNWILRRPVSGGRPPHVFVTHNGDWPAIANNAEYRYFHCDGLVCINPDFYERNKARWHCRLIPNGVDCERFRLGPAERQAFGLPSDRLIVLIVSALDASKNVLSGIEAVSMVPDAHLVIAGDGPLRDSIDAAASKLLPGRFTRLLVPTTRMPALYRSANVLLHLAKDEPFGIVFLEAMACGLPIVGRDSARLRWIVGDEEFLFANDRPETIAMQIQLASESPSLMREQRAKRSETFSWRKVSGLYRTFFQEIIESSDVRHEQHLQLDRRH